MIGAPARERTGSLRVFRGLGMIAQLRQRLQMLQRPAGIDSDPGCQPLGVAAIDDALGGGLGRGALHEIAAARGGDRQQPFGRETKTFKAGSVGRAAFGQRHVLGDPDGAFPRSARRNSQREPGRGGEMGLARGRNFVQCAARKPAAKRGIDRLDA